MIEFTVIDNETGKAPDWEKIALEEDWAIGLCYCDMEGLAITEAGALILVDECGRFSYCPAGRFTVTIDPEELRPKGRWEMRGGKLYCTNCGKIAAVARDSDDFWYTKGTPACPNCGAKMEVK